MSLKITPSMSKAISLYAIKMSYTKEFKKVCLLLAIMVICLIALPVFLILGIFSVKYRLLAKEAFRCFFKTVTLKPCDTGLDQKIKSEITARLMWWPPLASIFYNRFNVISWVFAILIITSTFF